MVGFIENEKNLYTINFDKKRITIGNKSINISNGIIEMFGIKHIEASLLFEAFGLKFTFNPRSLSAKLKSNFEIPIIKELRYEKARQNISKLQGKEVIVDTIIPRKYNLFRLGTLDWNINSAQAANNTNNINIRLGTELLFGEANFSIGYNPEYKLSRIGYSWRWINNNHKFINQAYIGPVSGPSNSSTSGTVIGASINNSSSTVRKSSGSYTFTDTTEPNWTVELYINDVLMDYTESDAAGLYVFQVPIVYGFTVLKLKFYGPLGEERTEERVKNTPYTFIPAKNLKYSLTTGIVQDSLNSRFAKVSLNYGITRSLTVAGGLEYLSSNFNQPFTPFTPFANVAYQPFSNTVLSFNYMHQNNFKGLLNINLSQKIFLGLEYTKILNENTNRNSRNIGSFNADLTLPLKIKSLNIFSTFNFKSLKYESYSFNQINWALSAGFNKVKFNLDSFINWASENTKQISSNLGLAYSLKYGVKLFSSTSYNFNRNQFNDLTVNLRMKISKIQLELGYQRGIVSKTNSVSLSANYDLPFTRAGISSSYSRGALSFSENAMGSMTFSPYDGILHTGNNSAIGKGGLLLHPFLDLNENGKLDKGEKKVFLSSVKISNAKAVISKKDSIVRIFDLNAFVNYTIEFSANSLDNIAWRFKHKTYKILVDPNQYKRVFIPVISVGEISGTVYLNSNSTIKGQSRVTLQILDEKENIVVETLSEFDGYYSYLGLKPGKYTVRIDPEQLKKLNYKALPKVHQVTIKVSEYGDIVDGLDFTLSKKAPKKPKE